MSGNLPLREVRRASSAGFHFLNLYQNCPRKWWFQYGLGIVPSKLAKSLIYGKAWHEALSKFYLGFGLTDMLATGLDELLADRLQYKRLEDYDADCDRMRRLLPIWQSVMAPALEPFDILAVETEMQPQLANGMRMTIRPDAVMRHRETRQLFIAEHKSTGWSIGNMIDTVEQQDQATAYIWGLWKEQPDWSAEPAEVLLDVAYNRQSVASVETAIIHRTKHDLATFELSAIGLFQELSQKLRTAAAPGCTVPLPMMFPRNGSACSQFGCEYQTICRANIRADSPLPEDFTRDPWYGASRVALEQLSTEPVPEVPV